MIKVNTGFEMGSIEAIDARIVLTSEQMLNINDNTQPDIYFAMNLDDGKLYIYDKSATPNETTGKFSILEGGANNIWSGTKEEYEAEKDDIPEGTLIIITDDEGEIITNVFADVTQEEYDALPDTKLTDGIAYIISEEDATTAKFVRNGKEISGVNYDEGEAISIESKELEKEKKDYSIGYYKTADLDNKGTLYPLSENSTVSYMYQGSDAYYVVKFSKAVDTYDSINFNYTTYGGSGVKQQGPINALTLAENTKLGYINFVKAENDELIFLLNGGCPNGMSIGPFSCSYTESIQGNFISVLYDDETIKLNTDNQLYANINFDNAEATSTLSGSGSTEDPIAVNTNVIATIDFVSNYTQADYSETRVNVPNYIRNKPTYANGIIESSEIEESNIYNIKVYEKYYNSMQKEYKEADYSDGKLNVVTDNVASANGICYIVISLPSPIQSYSNISTTIESVQASLKNCLPGEILYSGGSGSSSGGLNRTITFEKYDSKYYNLILKAVSYTYTASSDVHTPINATYQFTPIKIELYSEHNIELSLTEEQKAEDKIYGYNPVEDEWQEVEAGESIQVLELPEITDDNKDKVYEYVGETTDDYTKGHFYEAKEKTAMFYPYSTELTVNFREDLPDFIFVKNHEYVDNISVDDLYYKTGDAIGKTGELAKLKLKEGYSFELRRNDMFVIIQPTVDGEPAEDIDETHLQYNRLNEDDAEAVDLPVTEATVLEWTEVEFGGGTEVIPNIEFDYTDKEGNVLPIGGVKIMLNRISDSSDTYFDTKINDEGYRFYVGDDYFARYSSVNNVCLVIVGDNVVVKAKGTTIGVSNQATFETYLADNFGTPSAVDGLRPLEVDTLQIDGAAYRIVGQRYTAGEGISISVGNQISLANPINTVTEWEDELSDEKVPSEKLVKDTIDETIIQVEELPSAKANIGKIYQYIGETTETYTRGHFYEAVKLPKVTASFQQWAGQDTYTAPYLNVYTVEGTAQTKDNLYYLLNGEMYDIDPNEIETFSSIVGWTLAIKYYVKDTEFTYSKGSTSNAPYTPVGWKEVELGGSGDTIFTPDSNATTVAVGGVPKGYDFTDKEYTINEVLNMIFFPYVAFTYTALAGGGSYEYGKEVTISKVTPTYEAGSKAITTVSVGTTAGSNDLYEGTSYASGAITLTTSKTFDGTTGGKVYCKLSDGTTTLEQSTTVSYVKSIYYATTDSATVAPTSGTKGNNVDITVAADNYIYFLCPDTTKTQIQQYAVGQWNNVDTIYVGEVEFTNSENAALTYHAYRTPKLAAMTGKFQIK